MKRTVSTRAVILRKYRVGEIHKGLVVLTGGGSLLRVIAHGARKPRSRMAGASEPVSWVGLQLYHNPVSDSYKVTEIELLDGFAAVKGELRRLSIASTWHEAIEVSYAAGSSGPALYRLLLSCLRALSAAERRANQWNEVYVNIQFWWRFLDLLGARPNAGRCSACNRELEERETLRYVTGRSGFLCDRCSPPDRNGKRILSGGMRRYLERTEVMEMERSVAVRMEPAMAESLEEILQRFVQEVLDRPLRSLSFAVGAS